MRGVLVIVLLISDCAHTKPDSQVAEYGAIAGLLKSFDQRESREQMLEAEWQLPQALERARLLHLAFIYFATVARLRST